MKRLFILGIALVSFGASSFASENVVEKLNSEETLKNVVRYLGADRQQKRDLQYIFSESSKRLVKATAQGESAEIASEKALRFNLANAKVVLSPDQYKKFVRVLNITINNSANESFLAEK